MNSRRNTVRKEAIYVALRMDEGGRKYWASGYIPSKSALLWEEMKEGGVQERRHVGFEEDV